MHLSRMAIARIRTAVASLVAGALMLACADHATAPTRTNRSTSLSGMMTERVTVWTADGALQVELPNQPVRSDTQSLESGWTRDSRQRSTAEQTVKRLSAAEAPRPSLNLPRLPKAMVSARGRSGQRTIMSAFAPNGDARSEKSAKRLITYDDSGRPRGVTEPALERVADEWRTTGFRYLALDSTGAVTLEFVYSVSGLVATAAKTQSSDLTLLEQIRDLSATLLSPMPLYAATVTTSSAVFTDPCAEICTAALQASVEAAALSSRVLVLSTACLQGDVIACQELPQSDASRT